MRKITRTEVEMSVEELKTLILRELGLQSFPITSTDLEIKDTNAKLSYTMVTEEAEKFKYITPKRKIKCKSIKNK